LVLTRTWFRSHRSFCQQLGFGVVFGPRKTRRPDLSSARIVRPNLLRIDFPAYIGSVVTFIRNVNDIDAVKRRALEQLVGQHLRAEQQVVIRVVDVAEEPSQHARNEALAKAAEIARRGRAAVAAQGATELEVDEAIDEAIRHVREQKRKG
jgi:hypothetical protein